MATRDPFGGLFSDDAFFGGFGGGFSEMRSELRSGHFAPGTSTSRTSTTLIEGGKRITRTTVAKRFPDGRVETHVCPASRCCVVFVAIAFITVVSWRSSILLSQYRMLSCHLSRCGMFTVCFEACLFIDSALIDWRVVVLVLQTEESHEDVPVSHRLADDSHRSSRRNIPITDGRNHSSSSTRHSEYGSDHGSVRSSQHKHSRY